MKLVTAQEAARRLGIAIGTFRRKAPAATSRRVTGKRGRPAHLWTLKQIAKAKA